MDFYEFINECAEAGMSEQEALNDWARYREDQMQAFEESYYSDPYVIEGARQADIIDLYKYER